MSAIEPIEKLKTTNRGGSYKIELCDVSLVPDFKIVNRTVTTNIQSNPANWKTFYFSNRTLHFREVPEYRDGIEYYTTDVQGIIPKDRVSMMQNFKKLRQARFVGILTNKNGDRIVLGSKRQPIIFQLLSRDFKKQSTQRNETRVRIFVKKTFPSPHYLPNASAQTIWQNGEPMQWLNGELIDV